MQRKVSDFIKSTKTKHAIHTTLVSANEVIDNSYAGNLQSIITSGDLLVEPQQISERIEYDILCMNLFKGTNPGHVYAATILYEDGPELLVIYGNYILAL